MSDAEDDNEDVVNEMAGFSRTSTAAKKKMTIRKDLIDDPGTRDLTPRDNRQFLEAHKHDRDKDGDVKALVVAGIRGNRFCNALEDEELDLIFDTMEYFKFKAGEQVVRQGDVGYYFFVAQDGKFDVLVNGATVNEMSRGNAFGAIAILYACPRTATVVAKDDDASVWGACALTFKKILVENAVRHYEEHRAFINCIPLFDGLSEAQKENVARSAFIPENFEDGVRVCTEGEASTAMYFVKKGELSVTQGGSFDASGKWTVGTELTRLRQGMNFGDRAALYGEPRLQTVIAIGRVELVTISLVQLKMVLGDDLTSCLTLSFIQSRLRRMPLIMHLSISQQSKIAQALEVKKVEGGEPVITTEEEPNLQVAIVMDGEMSGLKEGRPFKLGRGEFCGKDAFVQPEEGSDSPKGRKSFSINMDEMETPKETGTTQLVAGPDGCRVAILSTEGLVGVLKDMGLSSIGSSIEALDYMRQVLCARKVPIFRELSSEQVNGFVNAFILKTFSKGAVVITQGEIGDTFFVIAKGEVNVIIDKHPVRTLGVNSCFGERSLLFEEKRTATVEVESEVCELWALEKGKFNELVCKNMREELNHRIRLQDTSVSLKLIFHVRLIGKGAFGSVRLVQHKFTGLRYALKRIKKTDEKAVLGVKIECELQAQMDHPFILHLVKTFETKDSIYILSELITGGNLHEQLQRMGVLTRKQAQFYVASLVLIIEHLHEKSIVYRDLKPENVMLDAQGYLKLVDFGLAKKLEGKTYSMVGTLFYMAPEIIEGHGYTDTVDIWAVGVMFFEMVCGSLPFGDEVEDTEVEVLRAIIEDDLKFPGRYNDNAGKKCMSGLMTKDPSKRLGVQGYNEIKEHKYFKAGTKGDIWSMIIGREMEPPVVPEGETYSDERTLDSVTLSDADTLGEE